MTTLHRDHACRLPAIRPTVEVFPASDGNVYVLTGGHDSDLVIHGAQAADTACLGALDGTRSLEQVAEHLREIGHDVVDAELEAGVRGLADRGVLHDAADDAALSAPERERYDRQLVYFGDMAAPGGSRAAPHARLRESRVAVIGVGGFGGWAALGLAACGVGRLDLFDGDVVETSNLSRQVLYGEADIGRPKVEVAAERLCQLNAEIEIRPRHGYLHDETAVARAVEGADCVIDAADWPVHRIGRWINQACLRTGAAHIGASLFPPKLRVGPLFVPGETACLECQEEGFRRGFPLYEELVEFRAARPSVGAPFGPTCGLIGSFMAQEAAHHLSGVIVPASHGAALLMDLRDGSVTREPVARIAGCVACGEPAQAG